MDIIDTLNDSIRIPIIAEKAYLNSFRGAIHSGYVVDNNSILPFVIRKKIFLKWIELPCAPLFCISANQEQTFVDKAVYVLKKKYRPSHIQTNNTAIFDLYPKKSTYCKFGTYIIDLSISEEELLAKMHSKHRNVVRRAEKDGITVFNGNEYAEEVVSLMNDTYVRQGKVSGLDKHFITSLNSLGDNVSYWVAMDIDGHTQGSAILLWSEDETCYYLHGGSANQTKPGSMNYLIWRAMLYMKSKGVKYFDFVGARVTTEAGSKLEGIQRFKSRFGADMKVGFMWRCVTSNIHYYFYRILMYMYLRVLKRDKSNYDIIAEERSKGNI